MKTLQKNGSVTLFLGTLILALVACAVLLMQGAHLAHGAQVKDEGALVNTYRTFEFFQSSSTAGVLNAVIATGTVGTAYSNGFTAFADPSGNINNGTMDVRGAKRVSLFVTRGGAFAAANAGTSTVSVEGTPDGTNWYAFNKLVAATTTASQTLSNAVETGVAFIGATTPGNVATSTQRFSMDLQTESFAAIRIKVVTTGDGAVSVLGAATF